MFDNILGVMQEKPETCYKEVIIRSQQGWERGLLKVIDHFKGILPMGQINKPVLISSIGLVPVYGY